MHQTIWYLPQLAFSLDIMLVKFIYHVACINIFYRCANIPWFFFNLSYLSLGIWVEQTFLLLWTVTAMIILCMCESFSWGVSDRIADYAVITTPRHRWLNTIKVDFLAGDSQGPRLTEATLICIIRCTIKNMRPPLPIWRRGTQQNCTGPFNALPHKWQMTSSHTSSPKGAIWPT